MDVKDVLRNRRIELGMTLKQVADAVGVSEGTVSRQLLEAAKPHG